MHLRTNSAKSWMAILALGIGTFGLTTTQALGNEKGLVGIRVGRSALEVLRVYGNPTHVQLDYSSGSASAAQSTPSPVVAPMGGGMPAPAGALPPGVAPMEIPPMAMPMMEVPQAQPTDTTTQPQGMRGGVIWTYELSKARTLDVYVDSDGKVDQVRVSGFNWNSVKSARGITLGDVYKRVLAKYGYPNQHEQKNGLWLVHYNDPDNITFVFDPKRLKVVAISVFRPS